MRSSFHTLADFVLHQYERFRTNPARSQDRNWTQPSSREPGGGQSLGTSFQHQQKKTRPQWTGLFLKNRELDAERRTAAAGALHLGILKLEAGSFERFHIIYDAAV